MEFVIPTVLQTLKASDLHSINTYEEFIFKKVVKLVVSFMNEKAFTPEEKEYQIPQFLIDRIRKVHELANDIETKLATPAEQVAKQIK
jgi:hypothetical protein